MDGRRDRMGMRTLAAVAAGLFALVASAQAQTFPSKPITTQGNAETNRQELATGSKVRNPDGGTALVGNIRQPTTP